MIGVRCEVRREDEWEGDGSGGGHWLRGVDYKSYKGEELLDRDCEWWEGRMMMREHTMELLLDDVVRVLEWLMLRGEWIGGMKELIYSILHDWVGSVQASAWANSIRPIHSSRPFQNTPKHHVHHPSLSLISQMEAKLYVSHSSFPLSYLVSQSKRKTLKVADLKEICTRANVPTTTRLTKADLITKILASQPAIDAYNAKYKQNGNAAPSSNPAPPSTHDDIVSRNASL